jgi:hypothetical protein
VLGYVSQVGKALQYVHERRLIHRDVKPENLLVGAEQEILLSDFGVAILAQSSRQSEMQSIGGTVAYMAPEQIQSQPIAASDQYALGVVVYEWLTGERPFDGSFTEIATKQVLTAPLPLRQRVPTLAPAIEEVVLRALGKEPVQRFPGVQAFAEALEAAAMVGAPGSGVWAMPGGGTPTLSAASTPLAPSTPLIPTTPFSAVRTRVAAEDTLPADTSPAPDMPTAGSEDSLSTQGQVSLLALAGSEPVPASASAPVDPSALTEEVTPATLRERLGGKGTTEAGAKRATGVAQAPKRSQGRLSRRAVLAGAVGVAGVASGLGWLLTRPRALPTSTRPQLTPTPLLPTPTPLPTTQLVIYRGHTTPVYVVAWSPDGTLIASGAGDGDKDFDTDHTVQVWEAATGKAVHTYRGHSRAVIGLAWSPDGSMLASASYDGTVQVWESKTGGKPLVTYANHQGHVWDVAWSPDGKSMASCGADGTVHIWEATTGKLLYVYRGHRAGVSSVDWSPGGEQMLSGSYDHTVHIWNPRNGTLVRVYTEHTDWIKSAVWSPDGKRVASGGGNNTVDLLHHDYTVQIWDAETGERLVTYSDHPLPVFAIIWSPDGMRLASCGQDNTVRVWAAADGTDIFGYFHHTNLVESLSWSPDGTRIASSSDDKTAQVWWAI